MRGSAWSVATASTSGVRPRISLALTLAPAFTSISTTWYSACGTASSRGVIRPMRILPFLTISTVSPLATFTLAPWSSSSLVSSALRSPAETASPSGV